MLKPTRAFRASVFANGQLQRSKSFCVCHAKKLASRVECRGALPNCFISIPPGRGTMQEHTSQRVRQSRRRPTRTDRAQRPPSPPSQHTRHICRRYPSRAPRSQDSPVSPNAYNAPAGGTANVPRQNEKYTRDVLACVRGGLSFPEVTCVQFWHNNRRRSDPHNRHTMTHFARPHIGIVD